MCQVVGTGGLMALVCREAQSQPKPSFFFLWLLKRPRETCKAPVHSHHQLLWGAPGKPGWISQFNYLTLFGLFSLKTLVWIYSYSLDQGHCLSRDSVFLLWPKSAILINKCSPSTRQDPEERWLTRVVSLSEQTSKGRWQIVSSQQFTEAKHLFHQEPLLERQSR